ncbi:MAG: apolipoprotein N-acyltransferase, partial [Desulfovibrionales bacterium]
LVAGVGDFSPGDNDTPLADDGVRIGMLICYEAIFPELAQKRVAQGANLLVNISNDAWFGDTSAPLQHLHLSVLRAVEQNRFVVRATNTGISALIDPKGRITHQSRLFQSGTLYATEVALIEERTFFSRHGRTVTVSLFAATALLLAIAARRTVTARP